MMAGVQKHVAQREPHLTRRRQQAEVIAICEDLAAPSSDAIDGASDPSGDRLHAAPEGVSITGFDNEMRVITQQRVVNEPKAGPRTRRPEAPFDGVHDRHRAKRRNAGTNSQGHMRGQWS